MEEEGRGSCHSYQEPILDISVVKRACASAAMYVEEQSSESVWEGMDGAESVESGVGDEGDDDGKGMESKSTA